MPEQPFLILDGNQKREARTDEFPSGLHRYFAQATSTQATTSNTFATILTLTTPVIPAGNYRIDWSFLFQTDSTNRSIEARILVDGVEQWLMRGVTTNSDGRRSGAGTKVLALTSAAHTIELQYVKVGGGGQAVTVYDRNICIQRWS